MPHETKPAKINPNSRAEMLATVRKQKVPPAELPSLDQKWTTYENRVEKFQELLESIGGVFVPVQNEQEIADYLKKMPVVQQAKMVVSLIPELLAGNFDLGQVEDPHELEPVDFFLLRGELGVAENSAIWLTDREMKHRIVLFITQHLSMVIRASTIVSNMYEAYQKISVSDRPYGTFHAGPSKTADIEQSLVIGAHGPRSLTVFCLLDT